MKRPNSVSKGNWNIKKYTTRFLRPFYAGLVLRSTAVATGSQGALEGTLTLWQELLCVKKLQSTLIVPLSSIQLAVARVW